MLIIVWQMGDQGRLIGREIFSELPERRTMVTWLSPLRDEKKYETRQWVVLLIKSVPRTE